MTVAVAHQIETPRTGESEWTVAGSWSAVKSGRAQTMAGWAAGSRTLGGHLRAAPEVTPTGIAWGLELSDDAILDDHARSPAGPSDDRVPALALGSPMRGRHEVRYRSGPERQITERDYRRLIAELEKRLGSRYGTMRELQVFFRAAIRHEEPRLDHSRTPWWGMLKRGTRIATA